MKIEKFKSKLFEIKKSTKFISKLCIFLILCRPNPYCAKSLLRSVKAQIIAQIFSPTHTILSVTV